MEKLEKELIEFLKYIKEVHTDSYGHLEVCDTGDELDPTIEKVVKGYIILKQNRIIHLEKLRCPSCGEDNTKERSGNNVCFDCGHTF